jgi:hypothetical protein
MIETSPTERTAIASPGASITNTIVRKTATARAASAARGQREKGPRNVLGTYPPGVRESGAVRFTIAPW